MTRLIVSREAETDLDEVLDYLEQEAGARTALSYAEQFRKSIQFVAEFPGGGAPRLPWVQTPAYPSFIPMS